MFEFVKRLFRRRVTRLPLKASAYEAADPNPLNYRFWRGADDKSINLSNDPTVRRKLRMNARYEYFNSCYLRGLVDTLASDVVGNGPRLQMHSGNEKLNERVERDFEAWARKSHMARKLTLAVTSWLRDGEVFVIFGSATASPVTLSWQLVEAEQVSALNAEAQLKLDSDAWRRFQLSDGIEYDERTGLPTRYWVWKDNPDEMLGDQRPVPIDARWVCHIFTEARAGQMRGTPLIAPALPVSNQLRAWTQAVLTTARNQSSVSGVYTTPFNPEIDHDGELLSPTPGESETLEPGENRYLYEGWDWKQVKAEQPVSTYAEFKRELIDEMARALGMPSNVARGNSSDYNFASGRLDDIGYRRRNGFWRQNIEETLLDCVAEQWLSEWELVHGRAVKRDYEWFWPGDLYANPADEANAVRLRTILGLTSPAQDYATEGKDWRKEVAKAAEFYGVTPEEYQRRVFAATFPAGGTANADGDATESAADEERAAEAPGKPEEQK